MVQQFFVPVITDPPWTPQARARRNAALWDESEAWKSGPRSPEIVLLAQPDRKTTARLDYSDLKEPEALQAALVAVLLQDGVDVPAGLQAEIALRARLRAGARVLLHDAGKTGKALVDGIGSRELWSGADASAALDLLDKDEATVRAEAKVLAHRLFGCGERLAAKDDLLAALGKAMRGDGGGSTEALWALQACLRARLRALVGDGGKVPAELRAELRELGVAVPKAAGGESKAPR